MSGQKTEDKPQARGNSDKHESDNPYMDATSLDELRGMEAQLYEDTWKDGKILPHLQDSYNHQMELFDEAFASLFPEDYDFHRKITPSR